MKGYRTLAFNAIMALLAGLGMAGVIEGSDAPDAGAVNAALDHIEALVAIVTPIGNAFLRFVTTTPVGKSS